MAELPKRRNCHTTNSNQNTKGLFYFLCYLYFLFYIRRDVFDVLVKHQSKFDRKYLNIFLIEFKQSNPFKTKYFSFSFNFSLILKFCLPF